MPCECGHNQKEHWTWKCSKCSCTTYRKAVMPKEPDENKCIKDHPHAGPCKLKRAVKCPDCWYKTTDPQKLERHKEKYCPARKKQEAPKVDIVNVSQFARIVEDERPGFDTKWLIIKHGCPTCGNITKYELKPPTMPAVNVCKHCTGPSNKGDAKKPIWLFNYRHEVQKKARKTKAASKDETAEQPNEPTGKLPYIGNKSKFHKNIFFLEKCKQKIPTDDMLPKKRKCPQCKKDLTVNGQSWTTRTYGHLNLGDCSYQETIFIAPSERDYDFEKVPWSKRLEAMFKGLKAQKTYYDPVSPKGFIPTVWGWFGSRRENLQEDLDKDLRDMGDLYSSRETKVHENAPAGKDKLREPKKGSTMVGMRKGSFYSFFIERVLNQPNWTLEFNYQKSGGMHTVGKLELDHWSGILSGMVTLIHNAGPILREKKLPEPTAENTYINQHAWPEYALEDRYVLDVMKKAYKAIETQRKIQASAEKTSNESKPATEIREVRLLPIPESRKRKKRPLYHDVRLVQTDLFKFFPQNQSDLFDFFEKDLPVRKVIL